MRAWGWRLGLIGLLFGLGSSLPVADAAPPAPERLDGDVRTLMQGATVVGLALAVIDAGEVVKVTAYGRRSREQELPLTEDTVMYGASLTKTAFAYMLLQLVDEGRLDLDASVADLLPRPLPSYADGDDDWRDLADDPRWRQLTPRILLAHGGGFANFRMLEDDRRLRLHFDPGSRYGYAAEGYYILQFIVAEGLGLDVGAEMQRRVFDRFGMTRSSMTWRDDFAGNLADGYAVDGTMEPHDERSGVSAAGSMDTTIADQARLWAGIMRGDGLSAASRAQLIGAQIPITSASQFPTLDAPIDPDQAGVGLAAGLGLVRFDDVAGSGWFKGGHNRWTANIALCLEAGQRCVVMLSNDVRAEQIFPALAERVLGQNRMPWSWEYPWLPAAVD